MNELYPYEFISEIKSVDDIHLVRLKERIYIGFIPNKYPVLPISRIHAIYYAPCSVYLYKGRRIFSVISDCKKQHINFYYVPDDELRFIESV